MTTRLERRLSEQRVSSRRRNWVIAVCLVVFLMTVTASYIWFGGSLISLNRIMRTGSGLMFSSSKINVLVLGVDERAGDVGRSDTMFAVTVDTGTSEAALLSVPRDTRVKIPGHGWDKINHAYAIGKEKLSQEAAEGLLGIPFDYYVVINFAAFGKIVDAVGGVDIDVEKRMYYHDPYDDLVIDFRPGRQHMDGKSAIKYVRYRGQDGDIGRIERQQKFIRAMLDKVTSPSIIPRVPSIIREVSSAVKTDMSTSEMLSMAKLLSDARKKGLKTDMVPGRPAYIRDISYWLPDIVALREHIAQVQGGQLEGKQLAAAEQLDAEYERSIPREMKVHEAPKAATAPKAAAVKPGDKPAAAEKASPPVPGKITVAIVNASGNAGLGPKMAGVLKARGFEVTGVTTSAAPANTTIVVSHSTSGAVVNQLTSLPFKYVLQIKNERQAVQATVYIGKDYK